MNKIKVTRQWVKDRSACRKSVRRFFERWPRGLTLNRRNLYMAVDELPMSDIMWFVGTLSTEKQLDDGQWRELYKLAVTTTDHWVISQPKKHAVAKALADKLGL